MSTKKASIIQTIDNLLAQLDQAQQRQKQAEARTEAGGAEGGTSHPSADVDDSTRSAPEGARSAENAADVKKDQGAISVDSTSTTINKGQDEAQLNLGTQQSATGEDPSHETGSAKPGKDDGGTQEGATSHPARTDNDSLDGKKFSAADVLARIKTASELGTALIARIAAEAHGTLKDKAAALQKQACSECAKGTCKIHGKKPEGKTAAADPAQATQAAQAGYELAGLMTSGGQLTEKQAEAAAVVEALAFTIQDARTLAEKTAEWLATFKQEMQQKKGEEGFPPSRREDEENGEENGDDGRGNRREEEQPSTGEVPGAAEAAGGMAPGGGGGGGDDESALIEALLSGGGGMGGGDMGSGGMGGGGMGGGGMGGGGMGGGGPGSAPIPDEAGRGSAMLPGGEGSGIDPQTLAILEQVLRQQGISPEELESAATAKAASLLRQRQKAAGEQPWRPKNAAEAQRFQQIMKTVTELVGSRS